MSKCAAKKSLPLPFLLKFLKSLLLQLESRKWPFRKIWIVLLSSIKYQSALSSQNYAFFFLFFFPFPVFGACYTSHPVVAWRFDYVLICPVFPCVLTFIWICSFKQCLGTLSSYYTCSS